MIDKATRLALLLLPATAASATAAEGGEISLFAGDVGNVIWTVLIFVLVLFVLGRFAWGPLLSTLEQREKFIRDSLNEARADREAAEARLAEYTDQLRGAKAEATEIVEEGRRDGEVLKGRIEEEARAEADRMVERAKREIDLAKQTALKEIYESGARLATDAAGRIIRRELSAADHERLVAESIANLRDLESRG